ncbi:MAG: leucine-rich repeat protein [Clostridia bacterium]|nr:leucine-rich repeat protein [Clostridia bacterium]
MQKKLLAVILIVALFVLVLASCTDSLFTVTFDVDGQVYTTVEVKKGGNAQMPQVPKKTGYNFDGWYLDKDVWTQPFSQQTAVINDITVYAHWIRVVESIPNTYTITFDSQGGSTVNGLRVKQGQAFTLPQDPTLKDFNFGGWYLDSACTTPFTTDYEITRNITVYAKWVSVDSTTYFVRTGSTISGLTALGKQASTITLPESLDGVKLTAIADELFKDNTQVKSVTFPSGSSYVSIGKNAFSGCVNLTEVKLINGISTIGEGAFSGCTSLKNVQLPTAITEIAKNLFNGCSSLQYATIYDSITKIGDGAYKGCVALTSVRIRENVLSVGAEAFSGCTSLRSVGIDSGVESIGAKAFYNCAKLTEFVLPDAVTSIGSHLLYGTTSLTSVTLSKNLTEIPEYFLYNAKVLETLSIPADSKITKIGASAFAYCTELENFDIPVGVAEIGTNAFNGCKDITTFVCPSGVTKLESQIFLNAVNLTSVTLHQNVTEIGNFVFSGCTELTTISGTENLTKIGSGAFRSCIKLNDVLIPASVEVIPEACFEDARALTNVTLSDGIKVISRLAFRGCVALEEITLPLTLTTIGEYAFEGCEKLSSVTIPQSVTSLSPLAFDNCVELTSIEINSANAVYEADGGIIFTKGKETMVFYSDALEATTYAIPEGVKALESSLFQDNLKLTSVTLPSSLTTVGDYAFSGCTALSSINFNQNLMEIGAYAFESTALTQAVLPIGFVDIGQYAFKNVSTLEKATLPITTLGVGKAIFDGCRSSLQVTVESDEDMLSGWSSSWNLASTPSGYSITYAQNRITSGEYQYFARDGMAVLTDYRGSDTIITVPDTIDGLPVVGLYKTFNGESAVTEITVPASVKVISEYTFKGMTALTTLTLPFAGGYRGADGVSGLFGYVFDYSENSIDGFTKQYAEGGALKSYYVDIPKTIKKVVLTDTTTIAYGAFSEMHNLEEITLPENVVEIKGKAFYNCSLVRVYLPLSLEHIGLEAFTLNFNRKQDVSEGAPSPQVTFDCAAAERPSGWIEGCFDENSKFNYAMA